MACVRSRSRATVAAKLGRMQTFTDTQRFTQAPDVVLAKYTDPAFLQRKYVELGRQDIEVLEQRIENGRARLRIAYSDKAETDLPDFARRFMPERQHIVQTVEWDLLTRTGRIDVEPKGAPVKVRGELKMEAREGGTLNTIHWTVSCAVPLIGGKLEKLLMEGIRQKAAKDQAVSQKLLSA